MTRRNDIVTAVVTAAAAATSVNVTRSKVTPIQYPGPGVIIAPIEEQVFIAKANTETERTLRVGVQVVTFGPAADEWAEPICAAIHAAIMADQTLGGLALRVVEQGTTWSIGNADKGPAAEVLSVFAISYRTRTSVLT